MSTTVICGRWGAVALALAWALGGAAGAGQTDQRDEAGFTPIFNGRDFSGWAGAIDSYEIVDGAIRCKPKQGGTIFTTKE